MCPNKSTDFENRKFDPLNSESVLELNKSDPDVNLFDGIIIFMKYV